MQVIENDRDWSALGGATQYSTDRFEKAKPPTFRVDNRFHWQTRDAASKRWNHPRQVAANAALAHLPTQLSVAESVDEIRQRLDKRLERNQCLFIAPPEKRDRTGF
jgi:hypothetical protein